MRTKQYHSNEERSILTALIVHDGVLERVAQHFGNNGVRPFSSKWSNLVAKWCIDYFLKYHKAPRRSIEGIFEHYAESAADKEAVELVEAFLSGLSADYRTLSKEMNEDFLVDRASAYFDKVRLGRMAESIQSALEVNDIEEARKSAAYEKIDFSASSWKNPMDVMKRVFRKKADEEELIGF